MCCIKDLNRPPLGPLGPAGSGVPGMEGRGTPVVPSYTARFKYHPTDLPSGAGGEGVPALLSLELLSENVRGCSPKCHETGFQAGILRKPASQADRAEEACLRLPCVISCETAKSCPSSGHHCWSPLTFSKISRKWENFFYVDVSPP